jgi:hypothetical protein
MTIKKRVKTDTASNFIAGAPDASAPAKAGKTEGVIRGKKRIITLGIDPDLLDEVDKCAAAVHISRAAWLNQAIALTIQASILA